MVTKILNSVLEIRRTLRLVFEHAVDSVNPINLIDKEIKCNENVLNVRDKKYSLNKNVYLVGFGKAVYSMAYKTELTLKEHLRKGIVSIPVGQKSNFKNIKFNDNSVVKVLEGALKNIPDKNAELAANEIANLAKDLKTGDILIVLVSGGGSALLPFPVPPVTLSEKADVIRSLLLSGAEITEINCIRKRLSVLKGGGLLTLAYPANVISFILSDIVGDPLDFISSGPTVPNLDDPNKPKSILEKYSLFHKVSSSIKQIIESPINTNIKYADVQNVLIGSNKIALEAALSEANKNNYTSIILTDILEGLVFDINSNYIKLVFFLCKALNKNLDKSQLISETEKLRIDLKLSDSAFTNLTRIVYDYNPNKICLLLGGEPTVKVTGKGIGGRSQQLALCFSDSLNKVYADNPFMKDFNVGILCAGTDGIDGPTDAAGAIAYNGQMKCALKQNLNPEPFIENFDSYSFFSKLNDGDDLLKIGHTGTNVMDIHIILIEHIK